MSKRSLIGAYTPPSHLLQPQEETAAPHVAAADDYKNQRFRRSVDVHQIQSYKERMAERAAKRQKPAAPAGAAPAPGASDAHTAASAASSVAGPEPAAPTEPAESTQLAAVTAAQAPGAVALTDAVLDRLLPKGYVAAPVPQGHAALLYVPPAATSAASLVNDAPPEFEGIAMGKHDVKHFSALVNADEAPSAPESRRAVRAQALVFRIKNGPSSVRKKAMRTVGAHAAELGAAPLFAVVLPLMLEPALDEPDRHILTKLVGRLTAHLAAAIRPYTHQVVAAVAPSLIDENATLRAEAREVLAAVARAAGLANLIASLRPDLDHADEYVRNLTARVFAVAAPALGVGHVLPFVRAVIRSQKSWLARHTGIRIVHHMCVLAGSSAQMLPHLAQLVHVLTPGLHDDMVQVRTATANTLALLAERVSPWGVDAFEPSLEPVWSGVRHHRGRSLAAFLRAIGAMVPLMAHNPSYAEYASYYTRELVQVMAREFASPDDDTKKALLRILAALPVSKTLFPTYRRTLVAPFLQHFWTRRVASDSAMMPRLVVDATASLATRLDVPHVLQQITPYAKDANINLRRMACDALQRILAASPESVVELDAAFDESLVDALSYAFQEQTDPHPVYLQAFATACKALGRRLEPHIPPVLSFILYRLKSSEPEIREQSADLIAVIAPSIHLCSRGDTTVMRKLILFLYESLGEVYPEVLGSLIGALFSCIDTMDRESLLALDNPSVNILLPTLTPILKNRHEKVQEQCIKLVGLIARRNAETINAKEWMRVCFDLLDMLKSQRKRIRVAANATFGHIAQTIGPQDVLAMLLNNLNVQERQLRVSTAVAIGIVADTCSPFTVLPALMNEYRVPDKNVQNGVLKALSFLFEYLDGPTSKDYLFAIAPLLEDALTDRDQVHRQIAATAVRHLALKCYGLCHDDYSDVFVHFLNLVLPNIYETSPHVIIRMLECLDALRLVLGPGIFFNYIWAGLFSAARKVRAPYWKVYNEAYVQNCDSLVPYYPRVEKLPDDERNYNVEVLDVWM